MISERQIKEILRQYERHGWNLRRVLLSAQTVKNLADSLKILFGEIEIILSECDAVWFSRRLPSNHGSEAWELRRLSGTPFALVEIFEDEDDEEVREETRKEIETQLVGQASKFSNRQS